MKLPALIIANGLPGSGKTTLTRRLARDLQVPRFARDEIHETLYEAMDGRTSELPPALGQGAFAIIYYAAGQLLAVGQSCIVENYFGRPALRSGELLQLQQQHPYEPIQLLCKADGPVLVERFLKRMVEEDRHSGLQDQAWIDEHRTRLLQGELEPLAVGGTLIEVDTTTPERMDYPSLLSRLRALIEAAEG
ncbi:AAA family ATPase [Paenibacillus sp. 1P07SE]|uniref:AAA family ATPase n=1 Tax=Paenibacillus sp. 1P07SE TaxID=3132209 RepID=UPI0039A7837F